MKLRDLASVIRSKNAGPFELTLDVLLKDDAAFELLTKHDVINKKVISQLQHYLCIIRNYKKV